VVWKSQPPSSNRFDRWNKELPKTADHKHRISIIKTLRELRISQEARKRGLHTSGNAEVEHILMALKESLPQNTQSEPHLSTLALCNPQQSFCSHEPGPAQPGRTQSGISLDTSSSVQTRKRKRQRHQPPDTMSSSSSGSNPRSVRSNRSSVSHTHTCTPMTSPRNYCQSTLYKEDNARLQHEALSQPMLTNYSLESPGHQPEPGPGRQIRKASFIQQTAPQPATVSQNATWRTEPAVAGQASGTFTEVSRQTNIFISTSPLGPTRSEANHSQISTVCSSSPSERPTVPAPPELSTAQQGPHFGSRAGNDEDVSGFFRLVRQSVQRANDPVAEVPNNAHVLERDSTTYNHASVSPVLLQSGGLFCHPYMPQPEAADAWLADQPSSGGLFYHPYMPQPEAADAWLADQPSSGGLFYHPYMPQPEAADAWLADQPSSGGLFYHSSMPQPEAADAWLADQSSRGALFDHPSTNMPPSEAAWVAASTIRSEGHSTLQPASSITGAVIANSCTSQDSQSLPYVSSKEIQRNGAIQHISSPFFTQGRSILGRENMVFAI
jgi:hypothetical protein